MANNPGNNGTKAQIPRDDLKRLIEEIASEAHIKDYKIVFEQEQFTGDNYCGEISRVQIIPLKCDQKPLNLFVKIAPTSENSRVSFPIRNIYIVELFFYTNIMPAYNKLYDEFNVPSEERFSSATFYNGTNEELKEIIILKDISYEGFVMGDKRSPLDYDHTALVLQTMAKIHAASFAMREKHSEEFNKLTKELPKRTNFGEPMLRTFEKVGRTIVRKIECPKNRAKLESFIGKIKGVCTDVLDATLSDPYNVISHGDAWINNMMFKYDKDMKVEKLIFVDWQVARYASPLADICFMLGMSTDQDLLQSHLHKLLDLYYETLGLSMNKMGCDVEKSFPKEVFMKHFRKCMLFGLSMIVGALPLGQCKPEDAKPLGDYDYAEGLEEGNEVVVGDLTAKRINGLVDFYVKNDLI